MCFFYPHFDFTLLTLIFLRLNHLFLILTQPYNISLSRDLQSDTRDKEIILDSGCSLQPNKSPLLVLMHAFTYKQSMSMLVCTSYLEIQSTSISVTVIPCHYCYSKGEKQENCLFIFCFHGKSIRGCSKFSSPDSRLSSINGQSFLTERFRKSNC